MAREVNFGAILKEERERRNEDLLTVARNIRIRPDVIDAIEKSDLDAMPPRGYARNMLNAYARYLGLNPTQIVKQYQEALFSKQTEEARAQLSVPSFDVPRSRPSGASSSRPSSNRVNPLGSSQRIPRLTPDTMGSGSDPMSYRYSSTGSNYHTGEGSYRRSTTGSYRFHRDVVSSSLDDITMQMNPVGHGSSSRSERRGLDGGVGSRHTVSTMYSAPDHGGVKQSKTPFLVAGIIVLLLCFVVIFAVKAHTAPEAPDNEPVMNVTGMPNSAETEENASADISQPTTDSSAEPPAPAPVEPEFTTIKYEVADGATVYIDLGYEKEPGKISYKVGGDITGPTSETFDVTPETGSLVFVTTDPDNVKLTQDGKELKLKTNDNGIASVTVSWKDFIKAWKAENNIKTDDADSTEADAGAEASADDDTSSDESGDDVQDDTAE